MVFHFVFNSFILRSEYTIAQIDSEHYMGKVSVVLTIASLIALACLAVEMYYLIDDKKSLMTLYVILMSGAAASMVLGFSPTIYVSGNRVFIYQYFSLYIVAGLMLKWCRTVRRSPAILILAVVAAVAAKNVITISAYIGR